MAGSKSLGSLTLDLIAKVGGFEAGMDKASRKSKKTSKQIEKHANDIGKAFAGLSIASVTGLTALVSSTAESASEIKNLSDLSGASAQSFQKITYAASRYGVEQEKVADILKDTNEKIGDFIQTGGGPLKDFFEKIAPQVGVTAEQFAKLSGPDALQLYVDSLQKAGVSQKEMTFYLEAIASDSTKLLPILRNNGKELKALGEEAERTGNVFSEMDFAELETITKSTDELQGAFKGISNEIVLAAVPAINDLVDLLGDEGTIETASKLGSAVVTSVNAAVKAIKGTIEVTQFLAEELAALTNGAAADDIVRLEDQLKTLQRLMDNPTERLRFFGKDGIVEYYDEDELQKEIAEVKAKIKRARDSQARSAVSEPPNVDPVLVPDLPSSGSGRPLLPNTSANDSGTETVKEIADAYDPLLDKIAAQKRGQELATETIQNQQRAYEDLVQSLRTDEERLTDQLHERLAAMDAISDLSDEERSKTASRIVDAAFPDAPEYGGLPPEIGGAAGELGKIDEQQGDLEDWYQTQLDMLDSFRSDRSDLTAEWDEQEAQLKQEHEEQLKSIEKARQLASLAATEELFGNLGDLAKQFAGEQSDTYKTLFAIEKAAAIARSILAIQTGIAKAASHEFPANLAAIASVASATAGIVSTIQSVSLSGQAHDGIDSVPEDGTWNLKKGERVTTAETSAKLDTTLDRMAKSGGSGGTSVVINDQTTGNHDYQSTETTGPQGQRQMEITIRDTMRKQIMRGEVDRQMGSRYDLKSKGRRV